MISRNDNIISKANIDFKNIRDKNESPTSDETENTNPSLRMTIRDASQEWITGSTIHALPRVFKTGPIYLKVIWLIFFFISFGVCAYIVTNYIINFFQWQTNVNIAIYTESPTNFPAISFCNLNPFYKKRSDSYINNVLAQNNLTYLKNLTSMNPTDTAYALLTSTLNTLKTAAAVDRNLTGIQRRALGWDISEMLMSCNFNGITCSAADFIWFQDYDYGNCFTFNGNMSSIKKLNIAGPSTGLTMELFLGDGPNDAQFVFETGAYIVIHNQTYSPLMESEGVRVAAGIETSISILRTFSTNQPYPFSNCIEDNTSPDSYTSDLYKAIFNNLNQRFYRQKYCFRLCYQQSVIADCKCSDPSLPNPYPTRRGAPIKPCYTTSDQTCMSNSKARFQNSPISEQCSNDCPPECSTIYFAASSSVSSYPTQFYSNWLQLQSNLRQRFQNNQTSSAQISGSVAKLNIFYTDMSYTNITASPAISWDVLLGNIGGQLGLFLGMSILTFAEIVEIIGEIIRLIIVHFKKQKELSKVGTFITVK